VLPQSFPTLEPTAPPRPIDPYVDNPDAVVTPPDHQVGDHIPVAMEIGDPSTTESMVVRIKTVIELPSVPNHRVQREADGMQRVAIKSGPGTTVTPLDRVDALRATAAFDAKDPTLEAIAKDAVRGGLGPRERVDRLIAWISSHISYRLTSETVASKVLANGYGDCSEMALLFVAMARAVGIPAREVTGLAGTHIEGTSAFGFHAWAEVAIGGRWLQVDPTWNEQVADASHIMLFEGDHDLTEDEAKDIAITIVDIKHAPDVDARRVVRELPVYMQIKRRR